ncbi:hypothetical protein K432DRAFT_417587 [Lepidopterella palustris CBS 459.81]|uniref:Uncharacterized protein n=1 Tax=Lepidopterella palustris CBS 459.81 TaxID=1314670 RepID=A0A8E2E897_9PEZI|nr:hypothetical protein K432DRAFT_417587 [Lepidopterella palustris CBS 459.81]
MNLRVFVRLRDYGLIVCKERKHAVWPREVESRLSGPHHRIDKSEEELHLPDCIEDPIIELALHNGFLSTIEAQTCQDMFRSKKRLQIHWQERHGGWTATGLSQGRQLTKIHQGPEEDVGPIDLWDSLQERAHKAYEEKIRQSKETIEEEEEDDVNPWLSRTKWHKYLKKPNPKDMMASVAPPSTDPENPESYETVIWKAMIDVAQISQMTVSKAGVFVRMEAVRSEKHQTRRVQPWRQMIVFLVRTQKEHDWQSPPYKFTSEQFEKFDRLIEEAGRVIDGEAEHGDGDAEMSAVQEGCLDFCVELLNMEIECLP